MGVLRKYWAVGLLGLMLLFFGWIYWLFAADGLVGLINDDGIYLVGAKSLALGQGYRLISEPGAPALIKYPPLFSVFLAPIWWLMPQFPQNLPWFKLANIALTMAFLALFYRYITHHLGQKPWLALLAVLLLGLNSELIYFSSNLMSEPLYLLLMLLAVMLYERPPARWPTGLWLAGLVVLSGLLFYTRTFGATLIAAIALCLWLSNRKRLAAVYAGVMVLVCLPWLLYVRFHTPPVPVIDGFQLISANQSYMREWLFRFSEPGYALQLAQQTTMAFFRYLGQAFLPLFERLPLQTMIVPISGLLILLLLGRRFIGEAFKDVAPPDRLPLVLVTLSGLMMIVWGADEQIPRFALTILPFLLAGFLVTLASPAKPLVRGLFYAFCIQALWLFPLKAYQAFRMHHSGLSKTLMQDYRQSFDFLKRQPDGMVYSQRSATLFYLYAGRQSCFSALAVNTDNSLPDEATQQRLFQAYVRYFADSNVRYLMIEPIQLPDGSLSGNGILFQAASRYPHHFRQVFHSGNDMIQAYRFDSRAGFSKDR